MEKLAKAGINFKSYMEGIAGQIFFENGYGASVIRHPGSYGNDRGLFELAVIHGNNESFELCYSTPVTSDVIGWLSEGDVLSIIKQIKELPTV